MESNNLQKYLIVICAVFVLSACNSIPSSIPVTDVKSWIENEKNGFSKIKVINNIELKASLLPPEYMALQEIIKVSKVISKEEFERVLPEYLNSISFNLRIKINDGSYNIFNAPTEFPIDGGSRLEYYMTKFKEDVCLVSGRDTFRCSETMAENNFNLSPYSNITLLFFTNKSKTNKEDICLVVSDKLFGTAYTNYCYDEVQIGQFPNIEF